MARVLPPLTNPNVADFLRKQGKFGDDKRPPQKFDVISDNLDEYPPARREGAPPPLEHEGEWTEYQELQSARGIPALQVEKAITDAETPPEMNRTIPPLEDTSTRPRIVGEPTDTAGGSRKPPPLDAKQQLETDLANTIKAPPEKQKWWKEGLNLAFQTINKIVNPQDNSPIEFLGDAQKRRKIEGIQRQLAPLQANEAFNQQRRLGALNQEKTVADIDRTKAETTSIPIDDELKRKQIEGNQQIARDRIASQALTNLNRLKHFDPKNPSHAALAQQAGLNSEDLQGWDDRNPITKQVAGVTYQYNRDTQSFEPSNLPVEERNTTTDYQVTMPNGEVRNYKVAQKDAANFSTQMSTLGVRLEHDSRERQLQRDFDEKKLRITQNFEREERAYKQAEDDRKHARDEASKLEAEKRMEEYKKNADIFHQELLQLYKEKKP